MTASAFLLVLLFSVILYLKLSPKRRLLRRVQKIYRLYSDSVRISLAEPDCWEQCAVLFFRGEGWSPERAERAGEALRRAGEDYMERQDILKTERENACELARRVLFYEVSNDGRHRIELRQTESIHILVEVAAQKYFPK